MSGTQTLPWSRLRLEQVTLRREVQRALEQVVSRQGLPRVTVRLALERGLALARPQPELVLVQPPPELEPEQGEYR